MLGGLSLILALAGYAMVSSSPSQQNFLFYGENMSDSHHQAFMDFLVRFKRAYSSKEDLLHRFSVFRKNYQEILEHNNHNPWLKKEVNHMADLTEEEFNKYFHGLKLKEGHVSKKRLGSEAEGIEVPRSVDWNALGKVSIP